MLNLSPLKNLNHILFMSVVKSPTMNMDELRNALPSGLTVWKIANEVQQCQQCAVYEIVTPTFAINGNTQIEPAVPDEDTDEIDVNKILKKTPLKKEVRIPSLLQQIAEQIDGLYCALPHSMKRTTEAYLKRNMIDFVMSDGGNNVLGPKKCRECVAYMQTPMLHKCDAFFILCSFLLDAKIIVDHQVYTWNHQAFETEIVLQCKN